MKEIFEVIYTTSKIEVLSGAFFVFLLFSLVVYILSTASNNKNWSVDQQVLPYALFKDNTVEIKNIRNFTYTSTKKYIPKYYDKIFNVDKIQTLFFAVEPFAQFAAAHTFLSFGFENGEYVAISVESRRKKGEGFSPLKGVMRKYELIYIIADEKDAIGLRTNHRKHNVYLYPIQANPKLIRELFINMLHRANHLKDTPEFYNTLVNSCTTNIVDHINEIAPHTIPWNYRLILPKNSDEFLYELGLIDNKITLKEARKKYLINVAAEKYADDPDFSHKIREGF